MSVLLVVSVALGSSSLTVGSAVVCSRMGLTDAPKVDETPTLTPHTVQSSWGHNTPIPRGCRSVDNNKRPAGVPEALAESGEYHRVKHFLAGL